ncbi:MAG: TetR family transcriptional regulator [Subtercola sp.]|nr:TetR family transcriptional regulator [Subtercola sp.]
MATVSRNARRAQSAERILSAASEEFARRGYEKTTIRAIADRAGVHASLVMQHYGSKAGLFAHVVRLPPEGAGSASEHLSDVLHRRLTEIAPGERALVRSMLTSVESESYMRDYLQERIDNLTVTLQGDDAESRATLLVCSILGLTIAMHFLHLPSLERLDLEQLENTAERWFDELSRPPGKPGVTPSSI